MKSFRLRGSIAALVTPMNRAGKIIQSKLEYLIEWHIQQQTRGLVIAGTTGESPTLAVEEHCELISAAIDIAAGRIPIIAGTGSNSTREAIQLTRSAEQAGADACLLVVPYYNNPTQEGLYAHFHALSTISRIPLILYNVPSRTVCDLLPETVEKLARLPGIVAIKEATGSLKRYREIRSRCGKDFLIYSGDDCTASELMLDGADGVISVTANVVPERMSRLCEMALSGDREAALALDTELQPLHQLMFCQSNPIPVKYAVSAVQGWPAMGLRLPLQLLDEQYRAQMLQQLSAMDLLPPDITEHAAV